MNQLSDLNFKKERLEEYKILVNHYFARLNCINNETKMCAYTLKKKVLSWNPLKNT